VAKKRPLHAAPFVASDSPRHRPRSFAALLGGVPFGHPLGDRETFALLDRFTELGGNFIDTARIYSDWVPGEKRRSERVLGDWVKARGGRERAGDGHGGLVIATKGAHPLIETLDVSRTSAVELRDDLEGSLRTLRLETIDLYWLHRDDASHPVGHFIDVLNTFQREGKIRSFGASNWTAARLRTANEYARATGQNGFSANQPFWCLGCRAAKPPPFTGYVLSTPRRGVFHRETGLAVIPTRRRRTVFLEAGASEGPAAARSCRARVPHSAHLAAGDIVVRLAREKGVAPSAIVLGYLWSRPFPVVPIIGSRMPAQVEDSAAAVEVRLSREELQQLETVSGPDCRWNNGAGVCQGFLLDSPWSLLNSSRNDRSLPPHARLPYLQEATRLLGWRARALSPRVRGDARGGRRVVQHRRRRIRRLPRPNGAGKTTTLKMLSGLIYPTSGTARVAGFDPTKRENAYRRLFALVMGQKTSSGGTCPPSSRSISCARSTGCRRTNSKKSLDELVALLDVEKKLNVMVRELSLGERMKMELIAALLHRPRVLFLDERQSGLDVVSQKNVRSFLRDYNRRHRVTILLTSHYMADIKELCERVVVIHKGKKIYDGALGRLGERGRREEENHHVRARRRRGLSRDVEIGLRRNESARRRTANSRSTCPAKTSSRSRRKSSAPAPSPTSQSKTSRWKT